MDALARRSGRHPQARSRILPRVNEAVNEEWISDKTRHVVDGLRTQHSTANISGRAAATRRRWGSVRGHRRRGS
jgi:NADH dehydrogenase/NADH:ubiquinone oxidoreductase subunit G